MELCGDHDALALYQGRVPKPHTHEQLVEFQAFLNRMSSRFDLEDEDEAMRVAIEEQTAGLFQMLVSYDLLYELEAVLLRPYC